MADEVFYTPEERLTQYGDLLIQSIIKTDGVSLSNRRYMFGQAPTEIFRNENYIIYTILFSFRDKNITPDSEFLNMYLLRNTKLLQNSRQYIDLTEFSSDEEDQYVAYTGAVLKKFNRLLQLEPLAEDDFKLTLEKYKVEYSNYEIGNAYSEGKLILYDGITNGRRLLQGYSDSTAYIKRKIAEIDGIMNSSSGNGFIDSTKEGVSDANASKPVKIGDFDLLEKLNSHLGGIFTEIFYSIIAPTKGGKSKFTTRMAHSVIIHGNGVSVWAQEGGYKAWWAQLRAIHYEYLYIRNKAENERVAPLSQKDILYGNYPSKEIQALEEASRLDLFTNPAYGRINMIDRPLQIENFIEDVDTSVKLNNSKFVLVDYLQLITSSDRNMPKNQVISKAYQSALAYSKLAKVAFVSPAQFTQDFMNEMAKSKDGKGHEIRSAGGESSEVVRTPDINIALYASVEDLIRKEMTIMSAPSRLAEPFPDIPIYADLRSCVFSDIDS